jgi:hypothetical protein
MGNSEMLKSGGNGVKFVFRICPDSQVWILGMIDKGSPLPGNPFLRGGRGNEIRSQLFVMMVDIHLVHELS